MSERIEELRANLENIGRDLTHLASKDKLGPIYERRDIISQIASLLSNKENSILLVGEPGTGKNAVVEGLARWMVRKDVDLPYKKIIECNQSRFQAFCLYAHELETKTQLIVEELRKNDAILFFDYINLSINAGAVSSAPERTIANLLNPYMDEITVLGATTSEGYKAMLKNNLSFTQRFVKVDIPETSPEDTLAILKHIQDDLTLKHQYGTFFDNGVFETLVDLAERFYRNRYFPGKAFEILKEITSTKIASHDKKEFFTTINKDDVFNVFKRRTGLPESIIFRDKILDKLSISSFFNQRIFGQNKAIEAIVNAITMLKSEMNDPKKPIATLFFAGPTGVGKTYLSRLLAEYLFGSDDKLLRYDMAEYSTRESISKLIGGPLSSTKGKLIEDVAINPFSVILFDEIEKAHPEIFNLFLSLTGEGRLTDHTGRTIDFCNTIIIMTSNIGAEIYGKTNMGLVPGDEKNYFEKTLIDKIADYFAPEFINRLTEIIAFRPLSKVSIEAVANNEIQRLHKRKGLAARNIKLRITKNLMNFLVDNGYSERFGARPMQRTVERHIGFLVGNSIIEGKMTDNSRLILDVKNNTVKIKRVIEINKTHD